MRVAIDSPLSIYRVDEALLASLAPDVIITQDLCEVCAVSADDVHNAVRRILADDDVEVVTLGPTRLEGVLDDIERIGDILGLAANAGRVRADLAGRMDAIHRRAAADARTPVVVSLEWIDPLMIGGTWMPELIHLAGGTAAGSEAGRPAPTVTPAALAAFDPEVIVIKPCGFSLERTEQERDLIESTILSSLPANTRVYLTDGNAFFNRPGPRLVESLEIMAACVHPERFTDFAQKHQAVIRRLR